MRWRLFDFGRVAAEVEAARGERAGALAAYRLSLLNATADVESALAALVDDESQARTLGSGRKRWFGPGPPPARRTPQGA